MAVACRPEELQGQERSEGAAGRDHLRSGESRLSEDAVEGDRGQHGQEEEQAAELGLERSRAQVKLPDIGDIGRGRPRARWAFIVGPARQACESFVLEDLGDGDRAEGMSFVGQIAADVVDGEVLLSQGDDAVTEGIGLGGGMGPLGRREEEVASGTLAELVDEDAEAPRGVTEATGRLAPGRPSTKKARRASYWRWVALVGSRKTRERSVSFLGSLLNIVPKCQIGVVSSRPKSRCGENHGKNGGIEMISETG